MASPTYFYPPGLLVAVARDILLLRTRDFHKDATACIENVTPPLKVVGRQYIPEHGPGVVTVNHYHRPGFRAEWLALAIAAQISARIHWLITGELMYQGKWYESIGAIGSRILLRRIAHIYGFTTMPPMPPRAKDVEARAASVRAVLKYVKREENPIIGLAPEGHDPPEGALTRPVHGVGRFGLLLSKAGLRFIPIGVYEADGFFHIRFGEPYTLNVSGDLSSDEKDAQASQIMMENIARLLPVHLRGEFA